MRFKEERHIARFDAPHDITEEITDWFTNLQ